MTLLMKFEILFFSFFASILTKDNEINVSFHGLNAHDIRDFTRVSSFIILSLCHKSLYVLGCPAFSTVSRIYLLSVSEPNDLSGWIATSRLAHQLNLLSTSKSFTLGVTFYYRGPGRICLYRENLLYL